MSTDKLDPDWHLPITGWRDNNGALAGGGHFGGGRNPPIDEHDVGVDVTKKGTSGDGDVIKIITGQDDVTLHAVSVVVKQ